MLIGLAIVVTGALVWSGYGSSVTRRPRDIGAERKSGFYSPLFTCLVVSIILGVLMWVFRR